MSYSDQPFSVGRVAKVFSCSIEKKNKKQRNRFWSVELVGQLFQPAPNLVEMVENDG